MTKCKNLLLQIDPLDSLNFASDSSLAIAQAALASGTKVFIYHPTSLSYNNGRIAALVAELFVTKKKGTLDWQSSDYKWTELKEIADIILIRNDPPFNLNYIHYTYLLEKLSTQVLVMNHPTTIRNYPEKIIPTYFPQFTPPTVITNSLDEIADFLASQQEIILKPIYGHGGEGVVKITNQKQLARELPIMLARYNTPLIAQQFLPAIYQGDKRVILAGDKIIGSYQRTPAQGDIKSNAVAGGSAHPTELTNREREISTQLGKFLKEHNVWFSGIDLIGEQLIEVNITSPTGLRVLEKLYNLPANEIMWNELLATYQHYLKKSA